MCTEPITLKGKKIPCMKCKECTEQLFKKWLKEKDDGSSRIN